MSTRGLAECNYLPFNSGFLVLLESSWFDSKAALCNDSLQHSQVSISYIFPATGDLALGLLANAQTPQTHGDFKASSDQWQIASSLAAPTPRDCKADGLLLEVDHPRHQNDTSLFRVVSCFYLLSLVYDPPTKQASSIHSTASIFSYVRVGASMQTWRPLPFRWRLSF